MKISHSKLALTATAAFAVLGFTSPKAEAAGGERLISHAHALENTVVKLNVEIREHYSYTSVFRHMLADTQRLHARAEHIDHLSHDPCTSLIHLRTDIIEVDKYVHHLHDLVDAADQGRYGPVRGDTRHVHSLMAYMERLVHSMEAEVANIQRIQQQESHFGLGLGLGDRFTASRSHRSHGSPHVLQGNPHGSYGGRHDAHRRGFNPRTDPRNINNYMSNQWNQNPQQLQQRQQPVRIDPRGLFNLFRRR